MCQQRYCKPTRWKLDTEKRPSGKQRRKRHWNKEKKLFSHLTREKRSEKYSLSRTWAVENRAAKIRGGWWRVMVEGGGEITKVRRNTLSDPVALMSRRATSYCASIQTMSCARNLPMELLFLASAGLAAWRMNPCSRRHESRPRRAGDGALLWLTNSRQCIAYTSAHLDRPTTAFLGY